MSRRISLALVLFALGGFLRAEDSVIGLPEPKDARAPGSVLLFGGGGITNDAWDRFIELAGGSKSRIVIVPSAGFRPSDYDSDRDFRAELSRYFGAWERLASSGRVASVEFLYTDEPKDADDDRFIRPLTRATGVWFSGGAQSRLNYRYVGERGRSTRFQLALREVVARGGVVGGTSAGMAALPEVMTHYQDSNWNIVPARGLGLFNRAIVEQHFDGRWGRLDRFTGLLKNEARLDQFLDRPSAGAQIIGLAADERTGLVVQGNRLQVVGRSNCHIFLKPDESTLAWHTLPASSKAQLVLTPSGRVALVK